ncbi:hypothetical protein RRG08_063924 [Elysia crispata]|uniref:Uncharacterized protein n=1 Tax=Elysia crispata TaxID=231223 RepID=A0AAE0YF99_9GAST|nr:hypothetical protein RRG08_063924 [Elysia crispata]
MRDKLKIELLRLKTRVICKHIISVSGKQGHMGAPISLTRRAAAPRPAPPRPPRSPAHTGEMGGVPRQLESCGGQRVGWTWRSRPVTGRNPVVPDSSRDTSDCSLSSFFNLSSQVFSLGNL